LLKTINISGNPEYQDDNSVRPNDARVLYCCGKMREARDRDFPLPPPKGDKNNFGD